MVTYQLKFTARDLHFKSFFTFFTPKMISKAAMSAILPHSWPRKFGTSSLKPDKNKQQKIDPRITLVRYHMKHPLMPRPLRLSRDRALRHWTIARAWYIWQKKKRIQADLDLQRLFMSDLHLLKINFALIPSRNRMLANHNLHRKYQSIQLAMEILRNLDDGTAGNSKEGSRLYRVALEKKETYSRGSIPIEYARIQVETPGNVPWDHDWKR